MSTLPPSGSARRRSHGQPSQRWLCVLRLVVLISSCLTERRVLANQHRAAAPSCARARRWIFTPPKASPARSVMPADHRRLERSPRSQSSTARAARSRFRWGEARHLGRPPARPCAFAPTARSLRVDGIKMDRVITAGAYGGSFDRRCSLAWGGRAKARRANWQKRHGSTGCRTGAHDQPRILSTSQRARCTERVLSLSRSRQHL